MQVSNHQIIHTGWGIKQGSNIKNWKRRWFVLLSNGELRYFEDKMSFAEKGKVQIDLDTSAFSSPYISVGYPIQIVTKRRTIIIAVHSTEEAIGWKNAIEELKTKLVFR